MNLPTKFLIIKSKFPIFATNNLKQNKVAEKRRKELYDYPVKILLAVIEAIGGNVKIHRWLTKGGYPELSALVSTLQADEEAFNWLMQNGYNHYAAFCNAIDDDPKAIEWLVKHKFQFLILMVDAVEEKENAIAWLTNNKFHIFIIMAKKILKMKQDQLIGYADYHKIHF